MAKLIFILFILPLLGHATEFVYLGEQRWPTQTQIDKTRFGGISGLAFRGNKIYLVSDDRGLLNEPRFYEFDFEKDKNLWKLTHGKVRFTTQLLAEQKIVDQEAIMALPDGHFLISSEGDNNKKPRVPPRIYEVNESGHWLRDVPLPPKVIPESTGQQKKGISNNFGFEAAALSADFQHLFFVSERPLVQDVSLRENISRFRFFTMKKQGENFALEGEAYLEGLPPMKRAGVPVVQGWSELLHRDGKNFWLLERTLRVASGKIMQYDCRLAELDMSGATEIKTEVPLFSQAALRPGRFTKVNVLQKTNGADLGNCEGMALGPPTPEFKQTLWIATDNNFSKTEDTALYFFGVKN